MTIRIKKAARELLKTQLDSFNSKDNFFYEEFLAGKIKLVDTWTEMNGFGIFQTDSMELQYIGKELYEIRVEPERFSKIHSKPKKKNYESLFEMAYGADRRHFGRGKVYIDIVEEK